MSSREASRETLAAERSGRIWVSDEHGRRRPFMRGIVIHSLTARGVAFDDAFRAANRLRQRLRGRDTVEKAEISRELQELLGEAPFADAVSVSLPPDVLVTGPEGSLPFSRGILAQSLFAAALEPNEAFDVAREIERGVVGRGSSEIGRDELRGLTRGALSEVAGDAAADRYLTWRRHQESDRPLVLLFGGAAGVGKSSLALEVAHRLGIGRVLSTDSIRQIMRITLSQDLVPALHASSFDAWRALSGDGSTATEAEVIEGFRAQASTVAVGVRASIERALSENTSLILDGVSIVPGMVDLDGYAIHADVIFMMAAALDDDAFAARFQARGLDARARPPHRYLEHLPAILRIQDHLLEQADRYDVPIVDNRSLEKSATFVIRHVMDTLRARRKAEADGSR